MCGRTAVRPYNSVFGWMGGRTAVRPYDPVFGWMGGRTAVRPYDFTISPFHYFTISLFNDFHLRHLITLTNLVDDIQTFYHAAEARVVAVEVCCIVA